MVALFKTKCYNVNIKYTYWSAIMQTEITELLLKVGIMPNKQGFKFLLYAIEAYIEEYSTLKKIYESYPYVSENVLFPAVKSNVYTIDSSIRNVIHSAYNSKKLEKFNVMLGIKVIDECPTNGEFIALASQYILFNGEGR